jgi:formate hydrogenlyase subunit 6/NADH:ubiquinone oxidoreductase subunit I
MEIERKAGAAPRTAELARKLARVQGPCVGCENCRGLCTAMIEAMTLPDVVLKRAEAQPA